MLHRTPNSQRLWELGDIHSSNEFGEEPKALSATGFQKTAGYDRKAMHLISTLAFLGSVLTATTARAGL
jgi:hypothetical protein